MLVLVLVLVLVLMGVVLRLGRGPK